MSIILIINISLSHNRKLKIRNSEVFNKYTSTPTLKEECPKYGSLLSKTTTKKGT
jgi:hypothetical protein